MADTRLLKTTKYDKRVVGIFVEENKKKLDRVIQTKNTCGME